VIGRSPQRSRFVVVTAVAAPRYSPALCGRASSRAYAPSLRVQDVDKVVDSVSLNDLDGKKQVSYCRCWRSATFPLCNGAHVAHNKASGDNVGPLLVKASE
jgi:CDGSH-type Zn-finger protein